MPDRLDLDAMSPRQRLLLFGLIVVVLTGIAAWILWPRAVGSNDPASSDGSPSGSAGVDTVGQSATAGVPGLFSAEQIEDAGGVATEWATGIASLRWDEDQQARTDRLAALLADVDDPNMIRWTSPSQIQLDDFAAKKRVLEATASVSGVSAMTARSVVLAVKVEQTVFENGQRVDTATAEYLVTVVPVEDDWRVSGMGSTEFGDPGYGG